MKSLENTTDNSKYAEFLTWATEPIYAHRTNALTPIARKEGHPVLFSYVDPWGRYVKTLTAAEAYDEFCRQLKEEYQVGEIVSVFNDGKVQEDYRSDYTVTAKYARNCVPFYLLSEINTAYDLGRFKPMTTAIAWDELRIVTDYVLILDDTKIFAQGKNGGWWEVNGSDFLPDKKITICTK